MMISKVMMGGMAAAVLALVIVFSMLLSAKERNGVLIQGIESAASVNERQSMVLAEVRNNQELLARQLVQEREMAKIAHEELEVSRQNLIASNEQFKRRLKDAVSGITDEELECAGEFVPAALIGSLWGDQAGSSDRP